MIKPSSQITKKAEPKVALSKNTALQTVASALGVEPAWLDRLIQFESAWSPAARNAISGARGLIQFTNTTARGMGFTSADDLVTKYPDTVLQLMSPVYNYLKAMKPYPTEQSLYMAIFYPAYRNVAPTTVFSDYIRAQNPNINTVADYVAKVQGSKITSYVTTGILILAGLGICYYIYVKQFPHNKPLSKASSLWQKKERPLQIVTEPI